jgi:hypothetical protein
MDLNPPWGSPSYRLLQKYSSIFRVAKQANRGCFDGRSIGPRSNTRAVQELHLPSYRHTRPAPTMETNSPIQAGLQSVKLQRTEDQRKKHLATRARSSIALQDISHFRTSKPGWQTLTFGKVVLTHLTARDGKYARSVWDFPSLFIAILVR